MRYIRWTVSTTQKNLSMYADLLTDLVGPFAGWLALTDKPYAKLKSNELQDFTMGLPRVIEFLNKIFPTERQRITDLKSPGTVAKDLRVYVHHHH